MTHHNKEVEIVERSSGYWVVGNSGVIDGPFIDLESAVSAMRDGSRLEDK